MTIENLKTISIQKTNSFKSKEDYLKFINLWKELSKSKKATIEDHVIYHLILGKSLDKSFTPITNENKITSNACDPHFALRNALRRLVSLQVSYFAHWNDLIPDAIEKKKLYSTENYILNKDINVDDNFIAEIVVKAKYILSNLK